MAEPTSVLAAVTRGPGQIAVEESLVEHDRANVLVQVEAVGLCGTDLHVFDGSFPGARYPVIQGHELAGRVVQLPAGYDGPLTPGDRVAVEPIRPCTRCLACRRGRPNACANIHAIGVTRPGGLQELLSVPVWACHPVEGLTAAAAALCEPMSIGHHAMVRAEVSPDDRVLVLGSGPIGLAALVAADDRGAPTMAVDLHPSRLDLARRLGAEVTATPGPDLDAALHAFAPDGPTVVVEAAGSAAVAAQAFDVVAPTGTVVMVGVSAAEVGVSLRLFTRKELTVVGARGTPDFAGAVAFVQRRAAALEQLVTHRVPLEHVADAFAQAIDHADATVKVLVEVG